MGRGRAKAKQTKVARELKYNSHGTDLDALRAELAGDHKSTGNDSHVVADDETEDEDDPYAEYAYDEDDEDDDEATGR